MNIQVFIAGDHASSKERVADLIRGCGFTPVDKGALPAAREIEDIPGETTVIKDNISVPKRPNNMPNIKIQICPFLSFPNKVIALQLCFYFLL